MKILVINGPNLNMLGIREPTVYGGASYEALCAFIVSVCKDNGFDCQIFQSNSEGKIVDKIQSAYKIFDGIIINPAAYTHTSIAIPDALKAVGLPAVEVHLTDITKREEYRRINYTSEACFKSFCGKGFESYRLAVEAMREQLCKE